MRRAITAMALCLAIMMVLSGCEVVSVNREKDMQQVVAQIGDTKIIKQEIYDEAAAVLAQDDIDINDENISSDLRTQIDAYLLELLNSKVEEIIIEKKAAELGITLTDEESTEIEEQAQETFDMMKMYYLGYDKDNPDDYEGEDIDADFAEMLQSQGFDSEQAYIDSLKTQKINTKLQEEVTKDVTATDEQVKKRYDTDLAAQKAVFETADEDAASPSPTADNEPTSPAEADTEAEEDPDTQYQTLAEGGSNGAGNYVLYKPSGYKVVKHILLELKEEDTKKVEAIDEKISELNAEISPIENDISEAESAKSDAEALIAKLKGEEEPDATATSPNDELPEATASDELNIEEMTEDEKAEAITEQQKIVDDKTKEIEELNEKLAPYQTDLSDAEEQKVEARQKGAENLQPTVDEIKKKYDDGTDFNDLIDEYNTDPGMEDGSGKAYGYLITPDGAGFVTEFSEASLALATVGQLSDPVLSSNGVHIIRLEMDDNEADMPYEKAQPVVREKVESELKTEKWEELLETTWRDDLKVNVYEKRLNYIK